ncbi:MAG: hypothetical protein IKZ49_01490 [Alphaproteobacteria bacterium]|nr:hypothetical protein [Alphaproteobacteria bacterium]
MTTKKTKIQKIKRAIKIMLASFLVLLLIVLGIFVRPVRTFENSHLPKWLNLSDSERIATLHKVVKNSDYDDIILQCVTKIATFPESNEMVIRYAISFCYNGIKLNASEDEN